MRLNDAESTPVVTRPLIEGMPEVLQEDPMVSLWMGAFDEVLAPVFEVLDGFPAYLDPDVAPEDFLAWLAQWVGVLLDENWSIERRRDFVRAAVPLYSLRGTTAGLVSHLETLTGGKVEVEDSGGVYWEDEAPDEPKDGPRFHIVVTVRDTPTAIDSERVKRLVADAKPAHVTHDVRTP